MQSRPRAHLAAALVALLGALSILAAAPLDHAFAAKGAHAHDRPLGSGSSGGSQGGQGSKPGSNGPGKGQGGGGQAGGGGGGSAPDNPFDFGDDEPSYGSVNPLDVHNPLCNERLKPGEERNCENTGSPETRYPTSNYGLEEHIDDSGSAGDTIRGSFQIMLTQIANAIWMATLFVLNLVLTLLGWAFELNPFSDNGAMREISDSLERFYRAFTSPWLVVAFVCLGVWGMWRGLFKREVAASIAGMAASAVLMIGGLVVLHEPRNTVGVVSNFSDNAAQTIVGAPLAGSLTNPAGSYASATRSVWNAMTLPGFAALNFTDVGWALDEPEDEIVRIANVTVCGDYLYGGGADGFTGAVADAAALVTAGKCASGDKPPPPDSNAEVWLRSSTGSQTRQRLWEEVTDDTEWGKYLSIQGGGGAWTRLPLVLLIALGLLGGILLLGWLAVRLLMQTAVAFVMLLATPLALFMPAFGDRGRAAFVAWATTLLGALISKLVYAGLLAVVLFATNTVAALAGGSGGLGTMTAFLIMAGLWWSVFLKRDSLLSFLTINDQGSQGGGGMLSNYVRYRSADAIVGAIAGGGKRGGDRQGGGYLGKGTEAGQEDKPARSESQLDDSATKRLDGDYDGAQEALNAQGMREKALAALQAQEAGAAGELSSLRSSGAGGEGDEAKALHQRDLDSKEAELSRLQDERARVQGEIAGAEPESARAASLVAAADERESSGGKRWGASHLARAKEALRREADLPPESPKHAWRVGMSPDRYSSLEGADREAAIGQVRAGLRADKAALGTISQRPAGAVGQAGGAAAATAAALRGRGDRGGGRAAGPSEGSKSRGRGGGISRAAGARAAVSRGSNPKQRLDGASLWGRAKDRLAPPRSYPALERGTNARAAEAKARRRNLSR